MSWRIVYIEESESVSSYLDNVKIKRIGEDVLIPYRDIHTLIIDNYKTNLTTNFLIKCAENKINLIICGLEHLPISCVYPINGNTQMLTVLKKQLQWSNEIKEIVQAKIIKIKIENQLQVLKKHKKDINVINKLMLFKDEVLNGDVTNREGLAAKMYFRELFGKDFIRFSDNVINYALNYGYTIMRTQISKVLISKGFNTSIGFFHCGPTNNFNLSDDIIEVFRPIVDDYVFSNMMNKEIFTRNDRIDLIKLTTKDMRYNSQKTTFLNVINQYVTNIIEGIESENIENIEMPLFINYDI